MTQGRSWQDMDPRRRTLIMIGGALDAVLRVAALIDLIRRPDHQVRGRKPAWIVAISVVNSFGVLPTSYFLFGRKRQPGS